MDVFTIYDAETFLSISKDCCKNEQDAGGGLFSKSPINKGEIVAIKGGYIYSKRIHESVEDRLGPVDIQIGRNFFIGHLGILNLEKN